ncbi:hypothetical protein OS493_019178 [Desmophyllum pertusum]|uniref:Cytochrome P450 n=1 Tax=Desmophyllum pertusum TaxID=174260 RepID=A0A9W9YBP8_9CNID|nr:hypothetical protein OS493_019178 [Desmophyllum pertusum]
MVHCLHGQLSKSTKEDIQHQLDEIPNAGKIPPFFNPYRHIDEDGKLVTNQGNFYPFGAGRRVCAGEPLAKVELFLFVSWMLQKFTLVGEDGHPPKAKGAFNPVSFRLPDTCYQTPMR